MFICFHNQNFRFVAKSLQKNEPVSADQRMEIESLLRMRTMSKLFLLNKRLDVGKFKKKHFIQVYALIIFGGESSFSLHTL